jgi:hypothetical protein
MRQTAESGFAPGAKEMNDMKEMIVSVALWVFEVAKTLNT